MSLVDDLTKYSSEYKKQIQNLDNTTLHIIMSDRNQALEYAKKGIQEVEPENLTDEYVEDLASEMQRIAGMILRERDLK